MYMYIFFPQIQVRACAPTSPTMAPPMVPLTTILLYIMYQVKVFLIFCIQKHYLHCTRITFCSLSH